MNLYNKKKITLDRLKIWILSFCDENNILLIRKILFSPLEDKIHLS